METATWATYLLTCPAQLLPLAQPATATPPVVFFPRQKYAGTRPARAATRPSHLLPAWLPPPPLVPSRDATQPRPPLISPLLSGPPPSPLFSSPSGARRRRSP